MQITFIDADGVSRVVDAIPGMSLMETAVKHNLPGIVAECGGNCACATCHVYIDENWTPKLEAADEIEGAMLQLAEHVGATSRLSCQITVTEELDGLIVRTPAKQR